MFIDQQTKKQILYNEFVYYNNLISLKDLDMLWEKNKTIKHYINIIEKVKKNIYNCNNLSYEEWKFNLNNLNFVKKIIIFSSIQNIYKNIILNNIDIVEKYMKTTYIYSE